MASVNKIILIGNLGQDPELKTMPSGEEVCNMSIATNEKWKDKAGELQERTEWHRIVIFGKQAANCAKFLSKGSSAYVEGKLQTRSWTDKEGVEKFTTEVRAFDVRFLSGNAGGNTEEAAPAGRRRGR